MLSKILKITCTYTMTSVHPIFKCHQIPPDFRQTSARNSTRLPPDFRQNSARIPPEFHQNSTRKCPAFRQTSARIPPEFRQNSARLPPDLSSNRLYLLYVGTDCNEKYEKIDLEMFIFCMDVVWKNCLCVNGCLQFFLFISLFFRF